MDVKYLSYACQYVASVYHESVKAHADKLQQVIDQEDKK